MDTGCLHKCPGCQNPQTHSFDDGFLIDIEEVKEQIDALEGQDGITFREEIPSIK